MKFQTLTHRIVAGSRTSQCVQAGVPGSTSSGHSMSATATSCAANFGSGDKGRKSSTRPISASRAVAAAIASHKDDAGAGIARPSPDMTTIITSAIPMPPPRGVARVCTRRPPGISSRRPRRPDSANRNQARHAPAETSAATGRMP